jgi:secreted trypsin-like serine protease
MIALLLIALAAADQRYPAIVNGIETSEPEAVVALVFEAGGDFYGPFCSGTLAASRWVVTAAHCVTAIQRDYAEYDVYVATGADLHVRADQIVKVASSEAHPDYDDAAYTDDIGLLRLEGTGLAGVASIPLGTSAVTPSWVGEDLRFVGYGITTDGAADMGTKRYADIPLFQYDLELLYGFDPEDGQNVCQGDSGGAALRLTGDQPSLVGVSAFVGLWKHQEGKDPCADGLVGATRVDVHADWIATTTGGEVGADTGEDTGGSGSFWGSGKNGLCAAAPRGGPIALLLALGLPLVRRRP